MLTVQKGMIFPKHTHIFVTGIVIKCNLELSIYRLVKIIRMERKSVANREIYIVYVTNKD